MPGTPKSATRRVAAGSEENFSMGNFKPICVTPQELEEHLKEAARRDKELLDQAEKIDRECVEQNAWLEKFPEIAEETSCLQKENFEKLRTIRVRRETFQHASRTINASKKIRHGNNARAAHKNGNKDNSGDDGGSDSSDPDLPWPGARARIVHPALTTPTKKEKSKYYNQRLSHCWRLPWSKCGVRGRAA
jgi:hypothetical protein